MKVLGRGRSVFISWHSGGGSGHVHPHPPPRPPQLGPCSELRGARWRGGGSGAPSFSLPTTPRPLRRPGHRPQPPGRRGVWGPGEGPAGRRHPRGQELAPVLPGTRGQRPGRPPSGARPVPRGGWRRLTLEEAACPPWRPPGLSPPTTLRPTPRRHTRLNRSRTNRSAGTPAARDLGAPQAWRGADAGPARARRRGPWGPRRGLTFQRPGPGNREGPQAGSAESSRERGMVCQAWGPGGGLAPSLVGRGRRKLCGQLSGFPSPTCSAHWSPPAAPRTRCLTPTPPQPRADYSSPPGRAPGVEAPHRRLPLPPALLLVQGPSPAQRRGSPSGWCPHP